MYFCNLFKILRGRFFFSVIYIWKVFKCFYFKNDMKGILFYKSIKFLGRKVVVYSRWKNIILRMMFDLS